MMNKTFFALAALCISITAGAQVPGNISRTNQILLSNGWKLSPAGRSLPLGDLPLNMQLSRSGKYLAVTNNGQSTQSLQLIDPRNEKSLDTKALKKSWYGIAFTSDEKHLYASGGNDNIILNFGIADGKLTMPDTISLGKAWPKDKICPTGIAVNRSGNRLYTVTKEDSSLYVIDPAEKKVLSKIKLAAEAYSCVLSPDEQSLYISLWGGDKVVHYNTKTGEQGSITVGSHPNELLLNKKGSLLLRCQRKRQ